VPWFREIGPSTSSAARRASTGHFAAGQRRAGNAAHRHTLAAEFIPHRRCTTMWWMSRRFAGDRSEHANEKFGNAANVLVGISLLTRLSDEWSM
jgi:hypothetical protein